MGLAVKPPGTPTMQYTIEQVEFPDGVADGAYVHSLWSEQAAGDDSYRITWILRKQSAGWRIVGMAAEMSDSEPPYFLNFEQPQDLYRRIQDAEREVADAAEGPAARTAAGPPPLSR